MITEAFDYSTKVYYLCIVLIKIVYGKKNLRNSKRMKTIYFSTLSIGKSSPILSRG